MRAEAMLAPSCAGCIGPEKIMVLPQLATVCASSFVGKTSAAPAEAPAFAQPSVTIIRS